MYNTEKKVNVKDFIPVNEPLLDGNEKKYLEECIDTGWISSEGPFVKRFEEGFSKRVGRKYGVAVANGTAAIDVAVEALSIGPGDEVILPTFTIISCIQQIIRSGATPVLIDSDPLNWNMNVSQIEAKITKKTKAIMVVHIYGLPVDMKPIMTLCKQYDIRLIEDSAEMIGQTYKGQECGSFGDISTVSFYSNKHITTGEGGMILTDNENIAENCRKIRNLCFVPNNRFVHERLGWNFRMTNIQAALGVAQLERLDEFLEKKRWIGHRYNQLLKELPNVQLPLSETDFSKNIYWVYGLVLENSFKMDAKDILIDLHKNGIGCRPFFCPMHKQPVLKKQGLFAGESYPVSEHLYRKGFYLPSGLALTEDQMICVSDTLKKILKG
jgi:perosamine synthetase